MLYLGLGFPQRATAMLGVSVLYLSLENLRLLNSDISLAWDLSALDR